MAYLTTFHNFIKHRFNTNIILTKFDILAVF